MRVANKKNFFLKGFDFFLVIFTKRQGKQKKYIWAPRLLFFLFLAEFAKKLAAIFNNIPRIHTLTHTCACAQLTHKNTHIAPPGKHARCVVVCGKEPVIVFYVSWCLIRKKSDGSLIGENPRLVKLFFCFLAHKVGLHIEICTMPLYKYFCLPNKNFVAISLYFCYSNKNEFCHSNKNEDRATTANTMYLCW